MTVPFIGQNIWYNIVKKEGENLPKEKEKKTMENNNNIQAIEKAYLGQEVLITAKDNYYHKRGVVTEVKDGFFPSLVIIFDGVKRYFHLYEVLKVNR